MRVNNGMNHFAWAVLVAALCVGVSGCGVLSQVNYWIYGLKVDPKYKGLEGKRVAVVCVSGSSVGPSGEASSIANSIGTILGYQLKGTEIVPQAKISDWMDKNDWDQTDYRDIGRGVKADLVLAIDLNAFSIHEGQTLLRGRAEATVRVLDMKKNGETVYGPTGKSVKFPEHGGQHITENENAFRRQFIYIVAQEIAHDFYAYDRVEDFAKESQLNNH